ncbi:hypothetical protein U1Q18_024317 [Sarracenia purpurea var. burkii]
MVSEKDDVQSIPLLSDTPSPSSSSSAIHSVQVKRTGSDYRRSRAMKERLSKGTVWTAIAHVITGVIGSGVLSLSWSVAQLGWIGGPLCIVVFGGIAIVVSYLLCDCYRFPDPEFGPTRNRSYGEAVKSYLGEKNMWVCGAFIQESYYGYGIAYTITAAISMRAIQNSYSSHKGGDIAPREYGDSLYMLIFGAVQVVFSQIPDFHNIGWLSILAAIMSFFYSSIGFGLGLAKTIGDEKIKGDIQGVPTTSAVEKVWVVSQALGDIAFAFTYNIILLEIQDTLKSPPPENQSMKKASTVAILLTTTIYLGCGCIGYAAFGNQAPGNLLTGFGFYEPYWLVDFANACIVVHLVGGYQVYSQPLFAATERLISKKLPNNGLVNKTYTIKLPILPVPALELNLFRLCFRTAYVASTTGIAILFPYFNQVLGVLGALNFWPLAIFFPVEMFIVRKKIRAMTWMWVFLQVFRGVCLVVTIVAFVGSVEGLVSPQNNELDRKGLFAYVWN